ncbi:hypothetical protein CISIN_1g034339mg [Citrus sinensis]|uniref:Uncharacterized protein n=1 Tax=Citrus sinensis TaxID=2711 RepID=A0A067FK95_CITSI|nr:hypothetical protein CISIN_1g034339mg [Citrus sinensis]
MSSGSDKRPAKVFKWAKLQFQNSKVSKLKRGQVGGLEQNQVFRFTLAAAVKLEAWCSRSMALGSRLVVDWPRTHNSKLQTRNKSRSSVKRGLSSSLE